MWVVRSKFSNLEFKLLFRVMSTAVLCILIYIILINISVYYIDHMSVDMEAYKDQLNSSAEDFQNYIIENNVSCQDINAIRLWDKKQNLMHIKLIENNKVIYDSLDYYSRISPKVSYVYFEPIKDFFHNIKFSDGQATLYITILFKQRLEDKLNYLVTIICILIFLISILLEFKKLVRAILEIKKGIQILEGGNLTYELKSERNDEITDLAESINRMSRELDIQRKEDERLLKKNYELVTSISHDIKTPLTTVNSYIDLIMEKKYSDLSELERYLAKIKEKSILINDLTDNLFIHFLNKNTDFKYNYEVIIGNDFIKYLLDALEEGLRDKGYQITVKYDFKMDFFLKVDAVQIQRVFNNLEGNLIKYALKSMPISYTARLNGNVVIIEGQNYILNNNSLDSHGVGILNCKEILKHHQGNMSTFIEDDIYHIAIRIPAYLLNNFNSDNLL